MPKLKIVYDGYDPELDAELEKAVKNHGWCLLACGYTYGDKKRDLVFDKELDIQTEAVLRMVPPSEILAERMEEDAQPGASL